MTLPTLARAAGVLGGLSWVVSAILDTGDGPAAVIDALYYGGMALLVVALLGIGAGLVSGLMALRVVVAICLVALAAAVVSFLHQQYADRGVDAFLGVLMVVYCAAGIWVRRNRDGHDRDRRHHRGSHAR